MFDTEKQIIRYDNLGIARLIYQLPTTVCASLKEVARSFTLAMGVPDVYKRQG